MGNRALSTQNENNALLLYYTNLHVKQSSWRIGCWKKPPFLKFIYLSLEWTISMSFAHTLKGTPLNFFINLLNARKVYLISYNEV